MNATLQNTELNEVKFLTKARQLAGKLPLVRDAVAMYFCLLDRHTPLPVKFQLAAALAYFVFPMDAIMDLLPGGYLDDAGVILTTLKLIDHYMTDWHYQQADDWLQINQT
jgi:uncharacterized membrane protein YkvA (DUF1232 family)